MKKNEFCEKITSECTDLIMDSYTKKGDSKLHAIYLFKFLK